MTLLEGCILTLGVLHSIFFFLIYHSLYTTLSYIIEKENFLNISPSTWLLLQMLVLLVIVYTNQISSEPASSSNYEVWKAK